MSITKKGPGHFHLVWTDLTTNHKVEINMTTASCSAYLCMTEWLKVIYNTNVRLTVFSAYAVSIYEDT